MKFAGRDVASGGKPRSTSGDREERMMRRISACLLAGLATLPAFAQDARPLRIAILEDMSGVYSDLNGPGAVVAGQLAIEDFGGTVLGRKIELLSADHQNKADIGAATARRWLESEGVEMITGLGNSSVGLAVRGIAHSLKKIDINTSAGSSDLTGKACSPTGFHWVYNTYAASKTVGAATVRAGADSTFFVAADYSFGHALARDGARFVEEAGGKVLGTIRAPLNTADFSSYILQAQNSKAKNIGLALAGQDLVNFIKQASEFGIQRQGQSLSAFIAFISDIKALGLNTTQGLFLPEAFYWDLNDDTRAFAKRFHERRKAMPNGMQSGIYSAITHYLKAVKAEGSADAEKVAARMRATPINDFFSRDVRIRADGRVIRDFHLFQVKKPADSKGDWDLLTRVQTLKGEEAFQPLAGSECPLVAQAGK